MESLFHFTDSRVVGPIGGGVLTFVSGRLNEAKDPQSCAEIVPRFG
jgi:hypothetical protein